MNWQTSGQILVQGLKGREVTEYTAKMKARGAAIVAGVNPSQDNDPIAEVPIFALVEEAIAEVGEIQTSLICVHPYAVLDAAKEAIAYGIPQLIIFSKRVPPLDMVTLLRIAKESKTLILGSGSGGILIPDKLDLGIWETQFYQPGNIGILSDNINLSYEVALSLQQANLGQSIVTSIGTDPILGTSFEFWLEFLNHHEPTKAIALITQWERIEIKLIEYIKKYLHKPIVIYAYNLHQKGENYLSNILNIMTNQLTYGLTIQTSESTIKDLLIESNIFLATSPSEVRDFLQ